MAPFVMTAPATVTNSAVPAGIPLPLRYFDCLLVLAFLPFALLAGLPELGSIVGVTVWVVQRVIGAGIDRVANRQGDFRRATGMRFAGGMLRPLLMGLTILAVGQQGEREDGLTAALIVLVAFTVYLLLSIIFRPQRNPK